jgi:hypothetical protein
MVVHPDRLFVAFSICDLAVSAIVSFLHSLHEKSMADMRNSRETILPAKGQSGTSRRSTDVTLS